MMDFERAADESTTITERMYWCHGLRSECTQKDADCFFGRQMLPHLREAADIAEGLARRLRKEIAWIEGAISPIPASQPKLDSPVWGQAKKPKGTQIY